MSEQRLKVEATSFRLHHHKLCERVLGLRRVSKRTHDVIEIKYRFAYIITLGHKIAMWPQ